MIYIKTNDYLIKEGNIPLIWLFKYKTKII